MNSYELSRNWFNWCFENPEKISPNHTAMYFFIIEHCNRLGWKEKFGLPMEMTKDAIGIKNYRTYSNTLNDLIEWGFITLVQKSKNQYSSNVIAIVKNTKANTKALDKAMQTHSQKQVHGIVCIDKPNNNITIEQINNIYSFDEFWNLYGKKVDRKKCEEKYYKLSIEQITKIKEVLHLYVQSKPEVKFRKDPIRWLTGENWNDEIKQDVSISTQPLSQEAFINSLRNKF